MKRKILISLFTLIVCCSACFMFVGCDFKERKYEIACAGTTREITVYVHDDNKTAAEYKDEQLQNIVGVITITKDGNAHKTFNTISEARKGGVGFSGLNVASVGKQTLIVAYEDATIEIEVEVKSAS